MNKLEKEQAKLNIFAEANKKRIAIILEGRDSAGKSGTIREATKYLNPAWYRVNTISKPSKRQMARYLKWWAKQMPKAGEIVFYDRSYYSRALCQRVNNWCSDKQYSNFMQGILDWESKQDIIFIKFWLSISEKTQIENLSNRELSPLQYWKMSPNDKKAVAQYNDYTLAKESMFNYCGKWHSINYDDKAEGRLNFLTELNKILTTV